MIWMSHSSEVVKPVVWASVVGSLRCLWRVPATLPWGAAPCLYCVGPQQFGDRAVLGDRGRAEAGAPLRGKGMGREDGRAHPTCRRAPLQREAVKGEVNTGRGEGLHQRAWVERGDVWTAHRGRLLPAQRLAHLSSARLPAHAAFNGLSRGSLTVARRRPAPDCPECCLPSKMSPSWSLEVCGPERIRPEPKFI